jgi:hypothetical protein
MPLSLQPYFFNSSVRGPAVRFCIDRYFRSQSFGPIISADGDRIAPAGLKSPGLATDL